MLSVKISKYWAMDCVFVRHTLKESNAEREDGVHDPELGTAGVATIERVHYEDQRSIDVDSQNSYERGRHAAETNGMSVAVVPEQDETGGDEESVGASED